MLDEFAFAAQSNDLFYWQWRDTVFSETVDFGTTGSSKRIGLTGKDC